MVCTAIVENHEYLSEDCRANRLAYAALTIRWFYDNFASLILKSICARVIEELVEAARKEDIRAIRVALAKLDFTLASQVKKQ